jgi:hypothetical protein
MATREVVLEAMTPAHLRDALRLAERKPQVQFYIRLLREAQRRGLSLRHLLLVRSI